MRKQKRKTLKQMQSEGSMKPSGKSNYARKKILQRKGVYTVGSPITL